MQRRPDYRSRIGNIGRECVMGSRIRAVGLICVALFGAAACTSSNEGTPSGTGSSTSSAPSDSTSTTPVTTPSSSAHSVVATTSSSASAHPDWCVDGEVSVAVLPDPGGSAAGHNDAILTFRNSSTRTCVLYGYPGVDALDSGGHVVAHAKRSLTGYMGGTYSGLHNVSLHPGGLASTVVEGDVGDGGPDCSAGASMVVTAPNLFHSTPVPGSPYVCDFTVHPVVAGTSGRQ
jgi:hypothetical protein